MNNITILVLVIICIGLLNIDNRLFLLNYNILCILFILLLILLLLANKKEYFKNNSILSILEVNTNSPELILTVYAPQINIKAPIFGFTLGGLGSKIYPFKDNNYNLTYFTNNSNQTNSDYRSKYPNGSGFDVGVIKNQNESTKWKLKKINSDENIFYIICEIKNKGTYYLHYVPNRLDSDCTNVINNESGSCYDVVLLSENEYKKITNTENSSKGWYIKSKGSLQNQSNIYEIKIKIKNNFYWLYTTVGIEDGTDYENDEKCYSNRKKKDNKCRNVFLVKEIYDKNMYNDVTNPIRWKLNFDDFEIQSKIKNSQLIEIHDSPNLVDDRYEKKNLIINGNTYYLYILSNHSSNLNIIYNEKNYEQPNGWSSIKLDTKTSDTWISVKPNYLKLAIFNASDEEVKNSEGWSCTRIPELTENNLLCLKESDGDNIELNFYESSNSNYKKILKDKLIVELSSLEIGKKVNDKYVMFDNNILNKTTTQSEKNPFVLVFFNNELEELDHVKLRISENEPSINYKWKTYSYKITAYTKNSDTPEFDNEFRADNENGPYFIFEIKAKKINYLKIEIINSNESILSIAHLGIYGKESTGHNKSNSKMQKQNTKLMEHLIKEKKKQFEDNFEKAVNDEVNNQLNEKTEIISKNLISFLNKPTSVIEWNNINSNCRKIKIKIGDKINLTRLKISNIVIMASDNENNFNFENYATIENGMKLELHPESKNHETNSKHCANQNLLDVCMSELHVNPYILISYVNDIYVNKILIYNVPVSTEDMISDSIGNNMLNNILPMTISLLNNEESVLLEAYKQTFFDQFKVYGRLPKKSQYCGNNIIENHGDPKYLREFADLDGIGKKCNYCRTIKYLDKGVTLSCASVDNQYENHIGSINTNNLNTLFIHKLDNKKKDNICMCNNGTVTCFEKNSSSDNFNNTDFLKQKQLDIKCNYNEGVNKIKEKVNNIYNSDNTNSNLNSRIDTGFYYNGLIFIFKNQTIGNKNYVIYDRLHVLNNTVEKSDTSIKSRFLKNDSNQYFINIPASITKNLRMTMCIENIVYFFTTDYLVRYNIKEKKLIDESPLIKINSIFIGHNLDNVSECCYYEKSIFFFNKAEIYEFQLHPNNNKKWNYVKTINKNSIFKDVKFQNFNTCVYINDDILDNQMFFITENSNYLLFNENTEYITRIRKINNLVNNWELDLSIMYTDSIRGNSNVKNIIRNMDLNENDNVSFNSNYNLNNIDQSSEKCKTSSVLSRRDLIDKKNSNTPIKCTKKEIEKCELLKDISNFSNLSSYLKASQNGRNKKYNISTIPELSCYLNSDNSPNKKYSIEELILNANNFKNKKLMKKYLECK